MYELCVIGLVPFLSPSVHFRSIVIFIRNHQLPLSIFRQKKTSELRKPSDTRFCASFLMLESIKNNLLALRHTVSSDDWSMWLPKQSHAVQDAGEVVQDTILSLAFRKELAELIAIIEPLMKALRLFDGNTPFVGKVYRSMFNCVEAVRGLDLEEVLSSKILDPLINVGSYC